MLITQAKYAYPQFTKNQRKNQFLFWTDRNWLQTLVLFYEISRVTLLPCSKLICWKMTVFQKLDIYQELFGKLLPMQQHKPHLSMWIHPKMTSI